MINVSLTSQQPDSNQDSYHMLTSCGLETVKYQWNRYGIVGPTMKLPFMGPFLESINPKFEAYAAKWASGPLSCVSVFHKSVLTA